MVLKQKKKRKFELVRLVGGLMIQEGKAIMTNESEDDFIRQKNDDEASSSKSVADL